MEHNLSCIYCTSYFLHRSLWWWSDDDYDDDDGAAAATAAAADDDCDGGVQGDDDDDYYASFSHRSIDDDDDDDDDEDDDDDHDDDDDDYDDDDETMMMVIYTYFRGNSYMFVCNQIWLYNKKYAYYTTIIWVNFLPAVPNDRMSIIPIHYDAGTSKGTCICGCGMYLAKRRPETYHPNNTLPTRCQSISVNNYRGTVIVR